MKLLVSFQGETHDAEISESATIQELSQFVFESTQIPHANQKILFRGVNLLASEDHTSTITICGLSDGSKIILLGLTQQEQEQLQSLGESDPLVMPFEGRPPSAKFVAHLNNKTSSSSTQPCRFLLIQELKQFSDHTKARKILERLAHEPGVVKVMENHSWTVGSLLEMYPQGEVARGDVCVLGLNVNKGQEIRLRLRTDDLLGFRDYETTREVLFHELSHMVHSEHNSNFFALMNAITKEANTLDWTRSQGHTITPNKIGNHHHHSSDSDNDNDNAIKIRPTVLGSANPVLQWRASATSNEEGAHRPSSAVLAQAAEQRLSHNVGDPQQQQQQKQQHQPELTQEHFLAFDQQQQHDQRKLQQQWEQQQIFQQQQQQQQQQQAQHEMLHLQSSQSSPPAFEASFPQLHQHQQQQSHFEQLHSQETLATSHILQQQQYDMPASSPRLTSDSFKAASSPTVNELVSMGFDRAEAEAAYRTNPNLSVAQLVDIILGSNQQPQHRQSQQQQQEPLQFVDPSISSVIDAAKLRASKIKTHLSHLASRIPTQRSLQDTLMTLSRVMSNVLHHPTEEKFRTLQIGRPAFQNSIGQYEDAMAVMKLAGWVIAKSTSDGRDVFVWKPTQDFGALWLCWETIKEYMAEHGMVMQLS